MFGLDAAATTFFATILGALIALISGCLVPVISQRVQRKAEREKIQLEKLEILYECTDQVRDWMLEEFHRWHRAYRNAESTPSTLACPIDSIVRIATFHEPKLKESAIALRDAVIRMKGLEAKMNDFYEEDPVGSVHLSGEMDNIWEIFDAAYKHIKTSMEQHTLIVH